MPKRSALSLRAVKTFFPPFFEGGIDSTARGLGERRQTRSCSIRSINAVDSQADSSDLVRPIGIAQNCADTGPLEALRSTSDLSYCLFTFCVFFSSFSSFSFCRFASFYSFYFIFHSLVLPFHYLPFLLFFYLRFLLLSIASFTGRTFCSLLSFHCSVRLCFIPLTDSQIGVGFIESRRRPSRRFVPPHLNWFLRIGMGLFLCLVLLCQLGRSRGQCLGRIRKGQAVRRDLANYTRR